MKGKLKLPKNLTAEQKQVLKKAKKAYPFVGNLEMLMSGFLKILEPDQSSEACELRIEIEDLRARLSITRNGLGEGLAKLGMLPPKAKPVKRATPAMIK